MEYLKAGSMDIRLISTLVYSVCVRALLIVFQEGYLNINNMFLTFIQRKLMHSIRFKNETF